MAIKILVKWIHCLFLQENYPNCLQMYFIHVSNFQGISCPTVSQRNLRTKTYFNGTTTNGLGDYVYNIAAFGKNVRTTQHLERTCQETTAFGWLKIQIRRSWPWHTRATQQFLTFWHGREPWQHQDIGTGRLHEGQHIYLSENLKWKTPKR